MSRARYLKPTFFTNERIGDLDPLASDWPLIRDYQRGFISVAGIERTGIYGNYDVVEYAKQMGLAAYFCQCVAWSDGELNPWRHIFQDVGPDVAGIHVDHLTIYGDEYGQWKGDTVSQDDFQRSSPGLFQWE